MIKITVVKKSVTHKMALGFCVRKWEKRNNCWEKKWFSRNSWSEADLNGVEWVGSHWALLQRTKPRVFPTMRTRSMTSDSKKIRMGWNEWELSLATIDWRHHQFVIPQDWIMNAVLSFWKKIDAKPRDSFWEPSFGRSACPYACKFSDEEMRL